MRVTQGYYTLNYRNYKNVFEFLNHFKSSEEQIVATQVEMTPDKRTSFSLIIALWNVFHY